MNGNTTTHCCEQNPNPESNREDHHTDEVGELVVLGQAEFLGLAELGELSIAGATLGFVVVVQGAHATATGRPPWVADETLLLEPKKACGK